MKIATYNVHNTDGAKSLSGIANEIKATGASFVGLQELDVGVGRSMKKNTLAELNKICRYPSTIFAKTIDYDGGDYGIGAMFVYPLVSMQKFLLPSGNEQRILIRLELETEKGIIPFFNTHFSLEDDVRVQQFEFLSSILEKENTFILTGDFNINSFSEFSSIKKMKAANSSIHPINTFKDGGFIDNIIISDNLSFGSVTLFESEFSDHNMLLAEVKI